MKTRIYILLFIFPAISLLYLSSCQEAKNLAAFDVSMKLPRQHFTYAPTSLKTTNEVILYSGVVHINLDSVLNANGFSSGIIQNTYFTYLAVTIEQPPDSTFHWLNSMRATVADNQNFQPENQIGSVTNTDANAKTVIVTLNNVNIRPYLTQPGFYVRVYGSLNGPVPAITFGMYLDGSVQFRVEPL